METKRCLRCGEHLPLDMFYHDKAAKDGLSVYCKKCAAERRGQQYTPKETFPEGYRRCTKCNEIKPLDEFHKTKKGRFGHASVCKDCRSRAKPKPQAREGYKFCSKCGEEKPATSEYFRQDSKGENGLGSLCRICAREEAKIWRMQKLRDDPDYSKRHYYNHQDKNVKRSRVYYENNKEAINARRREERKSNPEKFREAGRLFYKNNRQKMIDHVRQWRKDNPEKYLAYNQQWAKDNPEKYEAMRQAAWARRRARKLNVPSDFGLDDWIYCLEYWDNQCAVCGSTDDIHSDHWIPISENNTPGTVADNMIVLCGHCNHTKSAIEARRWLSETFGDAFAMKKLAEIEAYFEHVRARKNNN